MSNPYSATQAHHGASSTEDIPWLFLDNRVYRRLGQVKVRNSSGTTRVDHVIVSNYGIFVIDENSETGTFQASAGATWTQYKDEQSLDIPNPVRHLADEVHALQEALGMPSSHFISAVFFTGAGAYLKGEVPENVISEGFTEYVKSFKKVILSDAQVEEIVIKSRTLGAMPPPASKPNPQRNAPPKSAVQGHDRSAKPAPKPAPTQMKNIIYGIAALVLGALIASALFTWLG